MDPLIILILVFGFLAGGFFLFKRNSSAAISSSSTHTSTKKEDGQNEKPIENIPNELRQRLKSDTKQDEGVEPRSVVMRVKNFEEISSTVVKSSGSELQSTSKPIPTSIKSKVPEPERKPSQNIKVPVTSNAQTSPVNHQSLSKPQQVITKATPTEKNSIATTKVISVETGQKNTYIREEEKTVFETEGEDVATEPSLPIKDQLARIFQMRSPGKSNPPSHVVKEKSASVNNASRPLASEVQKQRSTPTKRKPPTKNRRQTLQSIEKKGEMEQRGRESVSTKILGETVGSMGVLASLGLHMQAEKAKREAKAAEQANMKAKEMIFVAAQEVKLKTSDENTENQTRLVHIKGRRRLAVRLVQTHLSSLNDGDSFILEHGNALYNWNGKNANKMEVAKSFDIARRMNTKEKGCRAQIIVLNQRDSADQQDSKYRAFFKLLGHTDDTPPEIRPGSDLPVDEDYDKIDFGDKLYMVHRAHGEGIAIIANLLSDGSYGLVDITVDKLGQELLTSAKVYVLDCTNEIFVWNGKQSGVAERKWAWEYAKSLQNTAGRVPWCRVSRETDGAETILFKEKFWNFKDELPIAQQKKDAPSNIAARREDRFDVNIMYKYNLANRTEVNIDDGEGKIQKMWRVDLNNKLEYPSDLYGHFFEEDSFIIWCASVTISAHPKETLKQLYATSVSLAQRDKDKHLLYFWQGRKSGIKKKGWSALLTADLGGSQFVTGEIMQLRIPQQLESTHFQSIYNGCVVIHKGHFADFQKRDPHVPHLYQARGVVKKSLRIVEVEPVTKSFNTNDVFLLQHSNVLYVWIGKASKVFQNLDNNNEPIKQMVDQLKGNREVVTFVEGEEPNSFWDLLGGKGLYFKQAFQNISLFHCHLGTGRFQADPVYEICQDELVEKDMMIMDISEAIFVWKGSKTGEAKEKQTLELALEYVDKDPRWNRKDCPVYFVESGHEPYLFTAYFQAWDNSKTKSTPELDQLKLVRDLVQELNRTYTLEELKQKPKGLDPNKLEFFLSDDEFYQVFGMTKGEYTVLPAWKRDSLRKKNGLF